VRLVWQRPASAGSVATDPTYWPSHLPFADEYGGGAPDTIILLTLFACTTSPLNREYTAAHSKERARGAALLVQDTSGS
jgi:hypothetical protein